MNKKSTVAKIATLGLLTTTLAFTNLEIAKSKTDSASTVALQLNVGEPAGAACRSQCAKVIGNVAKSAVRGIFRRTVNNGTGSQPQQQQPRN